MRNIIDTLFYRNTSGYGRNFKTYVQKPVTLKYPFEKPIIFDRLEGYTTSKLTKG